MHNYLSMVFNQRAFSIQLIAYSAYELKQYSKKVHTLLKKNEKKNGNSTNFLQDIPIFRI